MTDVLIITIQHEPAVHPHNGSQYIRARSQSLVCYVMKAQVENEWISLPVLSVARPEQPWQNMAEAPLWWTDNGLNKDLWCI